MDVNKTSTLIAVCERLLKMRLGDKARLQTIKARAEQGRVLYALDKTYVEKMAAYIKYEEIPQESPPPRPEPVAEEVVTPRPEPVAEEVVTPRPEPKQQSSFCSGCGTKIPSSNNFCTNCGTQKVGAQQQAPSQPSRKEIPYTPHPLGGGKTVRPIKKKRRVPPDARFCAYCERYVTPERDFSVGALLILLLLGIIPGIIYYFLKAPVCAICKHHQWTFPEDDEGYDDEFRRPPNF